MSSEMAPPTQAQLQTRGIPLFIWAADIVHFLLASHDERIARDFSQPFSLLKNSDCEAAAAACRSLRAEVYNIVPQANIIYHPDKVFSVDETLIRKAPYTRKGRFVERWRLECARSAYQHVQHQQVQVFQQMMSEVKALSCLYLNISPGASDKVPGKGCHLMASLAIRGESLLDHGSYRGLGRTLRYRLGLIALAKAYKEFLGLKFPSFCDFSNEQWTTDHQSVDDCSPGILLHRYCLNRVSDSNLFPAASGIDEKYGYTKPLRYLAAALTQSEMSFREVDGAIQRCQDGQSPAHV